MSEFAEGQVEQILNHLGIEIASETRTDLLCLCPYHDNKFTPALSVSKNSGLFMCFNPACEKVGNIKHLIRDTTGASDFQIARLLVKSSVSTLSSVERIRRKRTQVDFPSLPEEIVESLHQNLLDSAEALDYMMGRGFHMDTLKMYRIGYSLVKHMISTPMFDINGAPVGMIGRTVEGKRFRNSVDLPTGRTLWNIHNAKGYDDIIVVESNFDAMRVSQAGFPNVVACLGGNFSDEHADQLASTATFVTIMTDFDDHRSNMRENCRACAGRGLNFCRGHNAGRKLGLSIAEKMRERGCVVRWAVYDDKDVFPHEAKDPGDMTDEEIRQCIQNAESNFKYSRRNIVA